MTENIWFIAAIWMGLAFIASLISIRVGISVALIEIVVGVIVGNIHFHGGQHLLQTTDWINFLAMLGSGVLTFLAGAEIDPASLRANLRASMAIGILSFLLPFVFVWLFAQFVLGWPLHQAQIAGIALSTTSVAVVYAVMIEGGLGQTPMGKTILAACFITDFGTVLALGTLVCRFQLVARGFRGRHGGDALVHAPVDAVYHHPAGCDARERAGSEIHFPRAVFPGRPGVHRQKRSRAARLSGRPRRRGRFPARQNAGEPDAEHRLHDVHAVLFHQGRLFVSLPAHGGGAGDHRHFVAAGVENRDEIHRRLAAHQGCFTCATARRITPRC
jgi:hypothetical protein